MNSYWIKRPNTHAQNYLQCVCFWNGIFSCVMQDGYIIRYIEQLLENQNITFLMPQSDGDITSAEFVNIHIDPQEKLLVGSVAQRFYDPSLNYVLIPQDDGIFQYGLRHYFWPELLPRWEDRIPMAFWRGSGSRRNGFLRKDAVLTLQENPAADVKLIDHWLYDTDDIPADCISEEVDYREFTKYKMVLIIDGNGISSAHTWCFGIGAVPIMITNNDFWFKSALIPFGNYIPVKYDLSDLEEKIEWVLENDLEAKQIAERAMEMAYRIFTPEYQRAYLQEQICGTNI
jgi:hypothetical protein